MTSFFIRNSCSIYVSHGSILIVMYEGSSEAVSSRPAEGCHFVYVPQRRKHQEMVVPTHAEPLRDHLVLTTDACPFVCI